MIKRYFLLIVLTGYCIADDYFQQDVGYDIEVTLNDTDRTLSAFEKITYTNNSRDLSLIHISEPTRPSLIAYAVVC